MREKKNKAINEIRNLEERIESLPNLENSSNRIAKKFSKNRTNGKRIFTKKNVSLIIIFISILTVILVSFFIKSKEVNNYSTLGPENLRAMNYEQFTDGDEVVYKDGTQGTENEEVIDNVKFSSFFLRDLDGDGYAEKLKGTCKEIGTEDTLYMEIIVQTAGYLKDGKIQIDGKNFYMQTSLPKDNELKSNYIGNNIKTIEFENLNNGTQKLLTGIVRSGNYTYNSQKTSALGNNINNYSKQDNKIILTGIYVDENDEEHEIRKEINLEMDWYGTTRTTIGNTYQNFRDLDDRVNNENGTIDFNFTIRTDETDEKLQISKNHIEAIIPELNGYKPQNITVISSNVDYNYDEEASKLTIDRTASVNETGELTSSVARTNNYQISVKYPIEAYENYGEGAVELLVPVEEYYEGYNNPNTEFRNPYKSNVAKTVIRAVYSKYVPAGITQDSVSITVGDYISNPYYDYVISKRKPMRIYNGVSTEEKDDTYLVRWYYSRGTVESNDKIVLKETPNGEAQKKDEFLNTSAQYLSMEELTTNKGIYFNSLTGIIADEGEIKVYDEETGILLLTVDKTNISKYTSSNPFIYETPVKHIRVETTGMNKDRGLYVYNIKELDDEYITNNYALEDFLGLKQIKSNLVAYRGETLIGNVSRNALYEIPTSVAKINLNKNVLSTQITEENEEITITAEYDQSKNEIGWTNGTFLVKLPDEIIDMEINSVTVNNSNITISSYEYFENEQGKFIKILTSNNMPQAYTITINCNLTPDPRIATSNRNIELYSTNEEGTDYYYKSQDIYDVNGNLNTDEIINKGQVSISLVAPNSLLTNQTASHFDETGTVIISPNIAELKPIYGEDDREKQTVKIGVQMKNNYASTISEVLILGKIPFEGNSYVISKNSLNSEFTTTIKPFELENGALDGIEVPEELQGKVTIYYSENENPNKDLTNEENEWKLKEDVEDFSKIKTYIIDFGDTVVNQGDDYTFYYTIEIPFGVEFNKTAYSHHGIYFSLDTPEGKYRTSTEPNKIGIRISEKYNLILTKYQKNKEKLVPGATYKVSKINEDGEIEESKTAVTNASGLLEMDNLYVEKKYWIQEVKSPEDYELNENLVKIIGHVDMQTGELAVEKLEGTIRDNVEIEKNEGEDYKAKINVEDEVKAKLHVTKYEQGTENKIKGVKFKLTGEGLPTNGRIVTTNIYGEININGLIIGEEYFLEETKAEGYYLASSIKFKVIDNEGTYEIQLLEGTVKTSTVSISDDIPTINLEIENEKIPTYDLVINKVEKGSITDENTVGTPVVGAKFKLYKENKEIGTYETDTEGHININGLYQYESEKDINQTYILKEVYAPEGYAKTSDLVFTVSNVMGVINYQETFGEGQEPRDYNVDETTVTVTIEDSPSFKLIKKDGETNELLPNTKFAIYNVEDGEVLARNSKGEIIGTKEIINGREYYTLTTNENGEITADLPEGLYKAVEVEADEKYDIENKEEYFGIGKSREGEGTSVFEWGKSIGGTNTDEIKDIVETQDGGYIIVGNFKSSSIDLGNDIIMYNHGSTSYSDGMIVKYNIDGEVEWGKSIGGTNVDEINGVIETQDGGYILVGSFKSNRIDLGNGIIISNYGSTSYSDGMLIKYNIDGQVEWGKSLGGTNTDEIKDIVETQDGDYILVGSFMSSNIFLENGIILNNYGSRYDGMIIKFDSRGEIKWGKSIGGDSDDYINSILETAEGKIIVAGYYSSSNIDLGNGIFLSNNGNSDGMIIKLDSIGEIEYGKSIGGDKEEQIESAIKTSDGGYLVAGFFKSRSINLGNEIIISNQESTSYANGMIIKYNSEHEAEWGKSIESIGSFSDNYIKDIIETRDGGYIAVGYFYGSTVNLEDGSILKSNYGLYNGMVIKYNYEGNTQWGNSIGGSNSDYINRVVEIKEKEYLIGGYFNSNIIKFENGEQLINNGATSYSDVMLVKIKEKYVSELAIGDYINIGGSGTDEIEKVIETTDDGLVVGGNFSSLNVDIGNGLQINNYGSGVNSEDIMIIKYNKNLEVEKGIGIGGNYVDTLNQLIETSDGGYLIGGEFLSYQISLGKEMMIKNHNYYSNNQYWRDGMVIKLTENLEIEKGVCIGDNKNDSITDVIESPNGEYFATGIFTSDSIDLGNGNIINNHGNQDIMLIKLNKDLEIEKGISIGGNNKDQICCFTKTIDGGCLIGINYTSKIALKNGMLMESHGGADVCLIKYNNDLNVEYIINIGGDNNDYITNILETQDGGFVVSGKFASSSIDLGNGNIMNNHGGNNFSGNPYSDGMIIKYSSIGDVEWFKCIGGTNEDTINTIIETTDGEYIIGGNYKSGSINLEEGFQMNNSYYYKRVNSTSNYYSDGMIIKYDSEGKMKWVRTIEGPGYYDEFVSQIIETKDKKYLVKGNYYGDSVSLGNGKQVSNKGSKGIYNIIIAKYSISGEPENGISIGSDSVKTILELENGDYLLGSNISKDKFDLGNGMIVNSYGRTDGILVKLHTKMSVLEQEEVIIENNIKKFTITTEVNKIDNIKGGTISGEDESAYEIVKYGNSSINEIKINPDENYEIIEIKVNNEDIQFETAIDGTYTMPQFENMTENKHIVVTFAKKNNKIVINKIDSKTKGKIEQSGIIFNLSQIEEREEPINENIIGEIENNGQTYTFVNLGDEITGVLGDITNNGTNYFVEEDGKYVPTNSRTYQLAHGGTSGISGTATSYIPIDLSGLNGTYKVVVNANVSSRSSYDYGFATINQTTTAPAYSDTTGRFIYITGTGASVTTPTDYESTVVLQGGGIYYLHLGYRKSSTSYSGTDQFIVNSVKLYKTKDVSYNFIKTEDNKYESTNIGKDNTVCNSYIPIDLTDYIGKYNLTVNVEVSSQSSYDYGYVTITDNTDRPLYNNSTGRIICISGNVEAQDYETVLEGGKIYYLHMGYYKNESTSTNDDKFTINSINLSLNGSDLYHTTVETNSEGKAITQIPFGKYAITETKAPEGYILDEIPTVVEFRSTEGSQHEFTIENDKICNVIVHHYIKGTENKVAEDDIVHGKEGEIYSTNPKIDLLNYEPEKDINEEFIMPENYTGEFTYEDKEVIYYYTQKGTLLTVHHYIEGTESEVLLKDGRLAETEYIVGNKGTSYETNNISDEELSDYYVYSNVVGETTGIYGDNEIIVTYYYKKASNGLTINKYDEDGVTPLEGAEFIISDVNDNIVKLGDITNNGTYYFVKQENKYISNNQNIGNRTANSYMKIDMSKAKKDAKVIVNAEISSQSSYDIGYVTLTQSTSAPAYNSSAGRFVYISGNITARDYEANLEKGKVYYLHFGYRKNASTNTGTDTFTINSVNIEGANIPNVYITDEQGKIEENFDAGEYELIEVEAPYGYITPSDAIQTVSITKQSNAIVNITNERKIGRVIVHHYIEGTEMPIVEDTIIEGKVFDSYSTNPSEKALEKYVLVGQPENKTGTIMEEDTIVTYYYRRITGKLKINKVDKDTSEPLSNVQFGIYQGEFSSVSVPDAMNVGNIYKAFLADKLSIATTQPVLNVPSGWTGFAEVEGKYMPVNSIWYVNNQNNSYQGNSYADAYVNIDLSDKQETECFVLSADVEMRNTTSNDWLYAWFTDGYINGNWIQESGEKLKNYEIALKGGRTYQLQLSYYKGSNINIEDYVAINMKLYNAENFREEVVNDVPKYTELEVTSIGEKVDAISDILQPEMSTQYGYLSYYKDENKYIPMSSQKYKNDHEENNTNNISLSYFEIDLENKEGYYQLKVNAEKEGTDNEFLQIMLSENSSMNGYETIADIIGTKEAGDYTKLLEGGKKYYLFLGYIKQSDNSVIDSASINSIEVHSAQTNAVEKEIGFDKLDNGKYVSNNKGQNNTTAHSVIPIDLTSYEGNLELTVNAQISSEEWNDYGNLQVMDVLNWNDYANYNYYLTSISGIVGAQDYKVELEGGKMYYLHMTYNKNYADYSNVGDDAFTINEIRVETKRLETLTTNEEGTAEITLPTNDYTIVELEAKEGYEMPENPSKLVTLSKDGLELTIENEKKKGQVTVHHYIMDVNENGEYVKTTIKVPSNIQDEVVEDEIKIGPLGDSYTTAQSENISSKYRFVSADGVTSGEYSEEEKEVIYYYELKDFEYTVKYLEKDDDEDDTNNKVIKTAKVDSAELDSIIKAEDEVVTITGYTYDSSDKENITIGRNTEENVITLYYTKDGTQTKTLSYTVEYYKDGVLQEDDTQTETLEVHILDGDTLEVDQTKINVENKYEGYEFKESDPERIPNIAVDGEVIKIYYVAKIGKVAINHIDKNDPTNVLETEEKEGKYGETIETSEKDFEGYILVEKPDEEEYTYGENEQIVNYYYAKVSTGVLEKHLNVITGDPVAESKTYEGYEGKAYTTSEKEIEGYKIATNKDYYEMLAREDENFLSDNGVSSVEEYLSQNNIQPNANYMPSNATGNMKASLIEVKYYYIPKVKLIVKYVDILTGEELKEEVDGELIDSTVNKIGEVDEPYVAEAKEFNKYLKVSNKSYYKLFLLTHPEALEEENVTTLEEYLEKKNINPKAEYVPDNKEGNLRIMLNDDGTYSDEIVVTYYYGPEREVLVKYYDKVTGEEISEETVKIGPDGESYDVSDENKEIEGYTLVEEPTNPEGVYEETNEPRKFYYAKNTKVRVRYVDKETNTVIDSSENYNIEGYEGKAYSAEKKNFENYNFVEDSGNTEGTMRRDEIQVIYYYAKANVNPNPDTVNTGNTTNMTNTTPNTNITNITSMNNAVTNTTGTTNSTNNLQSIIVKDGSSNGTSNASPKNTNTNSKEDRTVVERVTKPKTGDNLPVVVYSIIIVVVVANLVLLKYVKLNKEAKSKAGKHIKVKKSSRIEGRK